MQSIVEEITELFKDHNSSEILRIDKLPPSGSDRIYFRIITNNGSYIATANQNVKENLTFFNFSFHFKKRNCPVPEIYTANSEQTIYIQQDFGDDTLLSKLEAQGQNEYTYHLLKQSLKS